MADVDETIARAYNNSKSVVRRYRTGELTISTSPFLLNLREISSPILGSSSQANRAGAVVSPSFMSAPPEGFPNSAVVLKSSISSTSCKGD